MVVVVMNFRTETDTLVSAYLEYLDQKNVDYSLSLPLKFIEN